MEQHNALERIASALERIAAALEGQNAPAVAPATRYRFPLKAFSNFDWKKLHIGVLTMDKDGLPLAIEHNGYQYQRRQSNNDIWFSRYLGQDAEGAKQYEKLIIFSGQDSQPHRLPPDLIESLPPRAKAAATAHSPQPSPKAPDLTSPGFASIDDALAELDDDETEEAPEEAKEAPADATTTREAYYTLTGQFLAWLDECGESITESDRKTAIYEMNKITGQVGATGWPAAIEQLHALRRETATLLP
jgi:hypothetical protein